MSYPLVSVIIPTYNYAHFITRAIESVLSQVYGGAIEIIVVDDGSTDGTKAALAQHINNGKIQYCWQANAGKATATQKAIAMASGEIIFNLDADDWFLPGKIQETVTVFLHNPNVVHVASPAMIIAQGENESGTIENIPKHLYGVVAVGEETLRYFFEKKMLYGGGTTFAARADVLKSICWNEGIDMFTDEWLLITSLLQGGSYFIPAPLSVWCVHGKNYSAGKFDLAATKAKYRRLEDSSAAICSMLQAGGYPKWLQHLYPLRHMVRRLVYKEAMGTKSLADSWSLLKLLLFSKNSKSILRSYHVFNRLLPSSVQKLSKKIKLRP